MNKKALINRRSFLKLTGTTLVALIGGGVWRAIDQGVFSAGEGPAYEPWKDWQTDAETGPLALVGAATLASNPHNAQPWLFRVTETRVDLFADTTRNIGAIDPYLREMYVGVGCALENLLLAARANGYAHTLTLLPDPANSTHIARVDINPLSPLPSLLSPLYRAIPQRHTNRGPYDSRPLPDDALALLEALGADGGASYTTGYGSLP
ncbi:MAG: hypothetical protein ACE5GO_02595 [Anaerolineales bacterium]